MEEGQAPRLLAELEIRHSRPIAPTRRLALGQLFLPTEPSPGNGGILLAAILAVFTQELEDELRFDLLCLLDDLEDGRRVTQPRLRHRFQVDVVGLDRSTHRLVHDGAGMVPDLEDKGHPLPQVLGATYAASKLSYSSRPPVFRLLRKAVHWGGGTDGLVGFLAGDEAAFKPRADAHGDDVDWALRLLGFDGDDEPGRSDVQRAYRERVFVAHPDHGGDAREAADLLTDLTEARRILLEARPTR